MIDLIYSKLGQTNTINSVEGLKIIKPTAILSLDIETYGYNKLPGDCAASISHGVAGVSLGNWFGDAWYIPVNDGKNNKYVGVSKLIDYLNTEVIPKVKILVLHNAKFDLGFLIKRGLYISASTKIIDTWIVSSIRNEGIYSSSKLKELVKAKFKIQTETKTVIDEYLEKNKTKDFGDIPVELIAPYGCNDSRYTLMLYFAEKAFTEQEEVNHDMYVRIALELNKAEAYGITIDEEATQASINIALEQKNKNYAEVKSLLGSTEIDISDEQVMLKYLHSQNLHSGPRDVYGEQKYFYDTEILNINKNNTLVSKYIEYHTARAFLDCFSPEHGEISARVFSDGRNSGIYTSMYQSLYAGGLVLSKVPDFKDRIMLSSAVRYLFKPRENNKFVCIRPKNLPELLLAYYCQDTDLLKSIANNIPASQVLVNRTGLDALTTIVLFKHLLDGAGNAVLEMRLKSAGVAKAGTNSLKLKDDFRKAISGFADMTRNINSSLESEGVVRDIMGRNIQVLPDKRYRSYAILISYSFGSYLSFYLDLLTKLAQRTNANLVLVHRDEFLFECNKDSDFDLLAYNMLKRDLGLPITTWNVTSKTVWEN